MFKTGGWGNPKLDLGGCVLYLPLWRPDMVASGGAITSGTGTMTVSPLALAVGANTITAATAGTFIITSPVGGTCASVGGGATITNSPVTITAGVATTVSTGVTTGDFTVTTSNIIRSKDSNNHSCTITEATWDLYGRAADGTNDKITCPAISQLSNATKATILVWANDTAASYGSGRWLFAHKLTNALRVGFQQGTATTPYVYFVNTTGTAHYTFTPTSGVFYHLALVFDGTQTGNANRIKVYVNTVQQTLTFDDNAPASLGDMTGASFTLFNDTSLSYWQGGMGAIWIYTPLAMSIAEIANNYLATKWRYL